VAPSKPQNSGLRAVHLVFATAAIILGGAGSMWGMIRVHAESPHVGAMPRSEIELLKELMSSEHESIRRELTAMRQAIADK
jgi:hypothetical protein